MEVTPSPRPPPPTCQGMVSFDNRLYPASDVGIQTVEVDVGGNHR